MKNKKETKQWFNKFIIRPYHAMLEMKHPKLRTPGTVPPMCPPGFQLILRILKKCHTLSKNMGKHCAKGEPRTVPQRELGTLPLLGGKNGPLRWYRKQLSGGTISNFHFASGCCKNEIKKEKNCGTESNFLKAPKVVQKITLRLLYAGMLESHFLYP